MRKDILHMLRRVQRVQACLERLESDDRLILDILLDGSNEKAVRIADEFGVSLATAYRYIDSVLLEIQNILQENMVELP